MSGRSPEPVRVLFLCTGNSCRSQMAEHILHQLGGERFHAESAGTRPAGFVHPLAIDALHRLGIPILFAESKHVDRLEGERFDAVLTLCDSAAREPCALIPGSGLVVHWGLPDPVYHPGNEAERAEFALSVAKRIHAKIEGLVALDWSAERKQIKKELERLGES